MLNSAARFVQAGTMRLQIHDASRTMHKRLMRIDDAAVHATNRHSRGLSKSGHFVPRPDDLSWHTAKSSFNGPLTAILALSAEDNSIVSRFGGAVSKINQLRARSQSAIARTRRRLRADDDAHARRLAGRSNEAHVFYGRLERRLQETHERRLSAGETNSKRTLHELPERHALSWVHEMFDWNEVADHGEHLNAVIRRRMAARAEGKLSHAEITKAHPTGWTWLDSTKYTQPSVLGDGVRRLLHRKEQKGADPAWHHDRLHARVSRRMVEAESTSHVRRLAVAFLEGTVAAPFAFADKVLPNGVITRESEISFWEAGIRYVVSSTVGCYFVKPVKSPIKTFGGGSIGGDGDSLGVLRPTEEKLCFPAVCFS